MRRKIMALILTGTMLAGISVNAMELERSMIGESVAVETVIGESAREGVVSDVEVPESAVIGSREEEAGIEEHSDGTAGCETFEKNGRDDAEGIDGKNTIALGNELEEGMDIIADSDMGEAMAMSEVISGKCGKDAYWEFDGVDTLTISGTGRMENYKYSTAADLPPWWNYREQIVIVNISEEITTIGDYAFFQCSVLQSIAIPDSVTEIGDFAFSHCSILSDISLSSYVAIIGTSAFGYCSGLSSIILPDSLTTIKSSAFMNCANLKSITLPDSVTVIEYGIFSGCRSLSSVNISDSVIEIKSQAFNNCASLGEIILPDSVTRIGDYAFSACSNLRSIVLSNNLGVIYGHTFSGCRSLESIVLPDSITQIGEWAFSGCSSLSSIELPDSVILVDDAAFLNCSALSSIILPENITRIGDRAFGNCSKFTKVIFLGNVFQIGASAFDGDSLMAYYPAKNDTWTADVMQDYGGTVTWKPYTNLEDIGGNDNPEDSLESILSTITLFPENNSTYVKEDWDGGVTLKLSTTRSLELSNEAEATMSIILSDIASTICYEFLGSGKVTVNNNGEQFAYNSWEESGIVVEETNSSLSITVPWVNYDTSINVILKDFIIIDNQVIKTDVPWKFKTAPVDSSFHFPNYGKNYISKDLIQKLFSTAQTNKLYKQNKGEKGVCYGMSLAEATLAYGDLSHFRLSDFSESAKSNWDLFESDKNETEDLTVDEYIQMCHMAQYLPEIQVERKNNLSKGVKIKSAAIVELVNNVSEYIKNTKKDPVILHFDSSIGGHCGLVYNYKEEESKTTVYIMDSRHPGIIEPFGFYKKDGKYTGEWYYSEDFKSGDESEDTISYTHPVKPFYSVYTERKKAVEYLMELVKATIPDVTGITKIEYLVAGEGNGFENDLYWMLGETEVPIHVDGVGDISIAGDVVEVQYNNLRTGTVNVSAKEDNFSFTTNQSGQKDAEVTYLFYNENDITKVTIRESEQNGSLEVYNKDEKIYFKGLNSAEIKTETGDYDENGDFVPENTVVKTFTNLSEEEEYEVDGSQEIEHIVRVSDDTVIPEGSPDETEKPLQNIQLSETEINLHEGESRILEVFYTPADTTDDKSVVWTSSDESVAAVDADGKIKAIKAGYAVITALVGEKSALCHVTVTENKQPDETEKPVSTETPSQPTEVPVSTDTPRPPIATSEPVQTLEPEKPGQTEIPVPTEKPEQPQPTEEPASTDAPEQPYPTGTPVPVHTPEAQKPLQSIDFEQKNLTLQPGETSKLNVIYTPADTTDSRMVAWTSSDEAVAFVTTEGTVTAHKTGTTEITAKVGEKTAVCTVTVKASGQESNADGENDNRNEGSNSNTEDQSVGAQQETGALSSPRTGERDNWMIYVILAGSILAGITAVSVLLRKKQGE